MKLKVKPSARLNRRYLFIEANSKQEIESTILDYIGILGWAKAAPLFINTKDKNIILAIERKELTNVRAAFESSDKKIKILRVSGTLKGLGKSHAGSLKKYLKRKETPKELLKEIQGERQKDE